MTFELDAGHRWATEHAVLGDLHAKARPVRASAFDQGDNRQPAAVDVERPDPRRGNVAVREATADDPRELADDVHADAHSPRAVRVRRDLGRRDERLKPQHALGLAPVALGARGAGRQPHERKDRGGPRAIAH